MMAAMAYKCLDCKDTKIYQGLGEPEPCRSCRFDAVQREPRLSHASADKCGNITLHFPNTGQGKTISRPQIPGTRDYLARSIMALPGVRSVDLQEPEFGVVAAVVDGGDSYEVAKVLLYKLPAFASTVGHIEVQIPTIFGARFVRFSRPGR